jgi:hypothetical protein
MPLVIKGKLPRCILGENDFANSRRLLNMANDENKKEEKVVPEKQKTQSSKRSLDLGARMGVLESVLLLVWLVLLVISLFYGIVQLWQGLPSDPNQPASSSVTILIWTFSISDEVRLLLIVALAGSLGGLVHSLRSFYWYYGNRELVRSWWAYYFLLPVVGGVLGTVFYIVIRGGFFSPQATVQQTNPFVFAAVAALVGMFSEAAVIKLKEVAKSVFKEPPKGENKSKALEKSEEKQ